jgi:hypothetical protein
LTIGISLPSPSTATPAAVNGSGAHATRAR